MTTLIKKSCLIILIVLVTNSNVFPRYYDADVGNFIGVDPAFCEDYMETSTTMGQVPKLQSIYNPININVYHYAGRNPVKYIDYDGRSFTLIAIISGAIIMTTKELADSTKNPDTSLGDTPSSYGIKTAFNAIAAATGYHVIHGIKTLYNLSRVRNTQFTDKFIKENQTRLFKKLGKKVGEGRLPFVPGRAGIDKAINTVRKTLRTISRVSKEFKTRGKNTCKDFYSKKTDFTVRIRKDGSFDTLIKGQTKFTK